MLYYYIRERAGLLTNLNIDGGACMKGLILFRSHYGNTKQVAESLARQITALGHEAVVQDLRQKLPDLQDLDFVMIGAPTRLAKG